MDWITLMFILLWNFSPCDWSKRGPAHKFRAKNRTLHKGLHGADTYTNFGLKRKSFVNCLVIRITTLLIFLSPISSRVKVCSNNLWTLLVATYFLFAFLGYLCNVLCRKWPLTTVCVQSFLYSSTSIHSWRVRDWWLASKTWLLFSTTQPQNWHLLNFWDLRRWGKT